MDRTIIVVAIVMTAILAGHDALKHQEPTRQVVFLPQPVIVVAPAAREIAALRARTEWLHEVMIATCKPDGFGARVRIPAPPQGWPAWDLNDGLQGAWAR
jgi:hypothetical protein